MSAIEPMIRQLRKARGARRLSQRALGAKAGLPQGHISRIEAGEVDLKLSSLVELARALDLEPMLVPRRQIKAVDAIIRSPEGETARTSGPVGGARYGRAFSG